MNQVLLTIITTIANILSLVIIVNAILSWFLPPLHPIRETLDRILQPIYTPIRKIIPPLGMMDITPIVLLLLIYVVEQIAFTLLR
jgi:YggT family protein